MKGIADYEFTRRLGTSVYLARTPARLPVPADVVAVKVVPAGEAALRRLTRELTAFAAVRSPYLMAPLDAGQDGDIFYYAMEYMARGSLTDREVQRSVGHAARAAAALHEAGIVHRGIKPGNILLHEDGARLSDLSLAHALDGGGTITGLGEVATVPYVDPALLRGEPASPGNDVWSLGCTLHQCLTGRSIYGDVSGLQGLMLLRRMLSTPVEVIAAEPYAGLIRDCLARTPSAFEVAERLEAL